MTACLTRRSALAQLGCALAVTPTAMPSIAAAPDPLMDLIAAYRKGIEIYGASEPLTKEDDAALSAATWEGPYDALTGTPPLATTMEGVIEALRLLIHEEESCENSHVFVTSVLGAALPFLEGKVS